MAATSVEIEEFLSGPLVTWLSTCIKKPESMQVYETFFDGGPINEVLLQIDPEPSQPVPTLAGLHGSSIVASRVKIFHCIVKNVKAIYEDELGQVVVALPDCVAIGRAPNSQNALQQLKLLILLVLGCAVQGPTKEVFITRIKELSLEAQHDIVECIKQVTDDQSVVLTHNWSEQVPERLYSHLRKLAGERDVMFQHWVTDLGQELPTGGGGGGPGGHGCPADGFESNHLAVELADWKARLRKLRQELEEKTELLTECKEELEHATTHVSKLKSENSDLLAEARKAKAYRDEVDAMRERAERVDRLEAEAQRYRERLADTDFYRVRVNELREDNRVLLETREMLEAQLARARQRTDHVMELESDLLGCKRLINDITLERDADREKIQELLDENLQLQQITKSVLQESTILSTSLDDSLQLDDSTASEDNSLSEQLTNSAQARALKLELENRKLLSTIDALKERDFHENAKKLLEVEKERKRLEVKHDQLSEGFERLKRQNRELDDLFKESMQENRKLQAAVDTLKVIADRQSLDLQGERVKVEELEKNIDGLTKEKQRVQVLCDTVKKRADDAEKSLGHVNERLAAVQAVADRSREFERLAGELRDKVAALEKESGSAQKEVVKLKEALEMKDRNIDEQSETLARQERELARMGREHDTLAQHTEKLQEYEHKSQELTSQAAIHAETISTLQKDLISEKVANERCRGCLEKLGLSSDVFDLDQERVIERMFENAELARGLVEYAKRDKGEVVRCGMPSVQVVDEGLQRDNARMQVDVATLTSQVNALQTQQTALQLANSQLVAEKEELVKRNEQQDVKHDTLLLDQVTMRALHDQLSAEYEGLKREREGLKRANRDLRNEVRALKDAGGVLDGKLASLEQEKDALKDESRSLSNLRTEHSKLKDDFRNLFTANDRLKTEYRGLQEENKTLKAESSRLRMSSAEMQCELNTRSDHVSGLQVENAKLHQRCDLLVEMNHTLDADRRALMEHASKLLSQFHSLLVHSLDDKQHYHMEEKMFTDKLNNLCRQKEKLEEKIMEHYRKLDNASAKKKGFGATLVRRVRKAGTDVMNRIPRNNRRSWQEEAPAQQRLSQSSQFLLGGGGSGESGGNDSDNSADQEDHAVQKVAAAEPFKRSAGSLHGQKPRDEIALRRSQRNSVAGDQVYTRENPTAPLSLGSVGTRRTVYLSEDDPAPSPAPAPNTPAAPGAVPQTPQPPLLVYNRISTVIGAPNNNSSSPAPQQPPAALTTPPQDDNTATTNPADRKKLDNAKENAIWYEYGCV